MGWVQDDLFDMSPGPGVSCPAVRVTLAGPVVDATAVREDREVLLGMPLRGSNKADATVLVVVVVPTHEGPYPVSGGRKRFERARREGRAILQSAKEGLGEGVVVADVGTTEGRH